MYHQLLSACLTIALVYLSYLTTRTGTVVLLYVSDFLRKVHTDLQNRDVKVQRNSADWNDNGARAWHVAAG